MTNIAQPDEGSLPGEIAAATGVNSSSPNVSDPLDVSFSSPGVVVADPADAPGAIDPLDVSDSQPASVPPAEPRG